MAVKILMTRRYRPLVATWVGHCPVCQGSIADGEIVHEWSDGKLTHEGCRIR